MFAVWCAVWCCILIFLVVYCSKAAIQTSCFSRNEARVKFVKTKVCRSWHSCSLSQSIIVKSSINPNCIKNKYHLKMYSLQSINTWEKINISFLCIQKSIKLLLLEIVIWTITSFLSVHGSISGGVAKYLCNSPKKRNTR